MSGKTWSWLLVKDECISCGICADVCGPGAIVMTEKMALPDYNPALCTGCADCACNCPVDVIQVVHANEDVLERGHPEKGSRS